MRKTSESICTAALERQICENRDPARNGHRVLHAIRHPARRRPERFDRGGDDQHRREAVDDDDGFAGRANETLTAREWAGSEQRVPELEARGARERDRGELERAMSHDERGERAAETALREIAGDTAEHGP